MGEGGRPAKPTKQKVLQGTFREDRANENEPEPMEYEKIPEAPWYLDYYAQKEWERAAPVLIEAGLLTKADLSLFQDYCEVHAHCVRLNRKMREGDADPYEFVTDNGYRQKTPLISIYEDLVDLKKKLANQLGLSPSARTKIEVDVKADNYKSVEDILNSDVS